MHCPAVGRVKHILCHPAARLIGRAGACPPPTRAGGKGSAADEIIESAGVGPPEGFAGGAGQTLGFDLGTLGLASAHDARGSPANLPRDGAFVLKLFAGCSSQ